MILKKCKLLSILSGLVHQALFGEVVLAYSSKARKHFWGADLTQRYAFVVEGARLRPHLKPNDEPHMSQEARRLD
jgi:hypothetical protein